MMGQLFVLLGIPLKDQHPYGKSTIKTVYVPLLVELIEYL